MGQAAPAARPLDALLGIDVGTTSCKAAVVTLDGREIAAGYAQTPWQRCAGVAQADPGSLKSAAQRAATMALRSGPPMRIAAVGVTSMAETGVLVDSHGSPVAPAIAWFDHRGEREADELRSSLGDTEFAEITGLAISPLCSLIKHRWLVTNRPASREGRRWFSIAEWLVRQFGGHEVAELSLASRTGFFDVRRTAWSSPILEWARVDDTFLPPPVPAGTPCGTVASGLPGARGATLTIAGHDHLCAAVGAGALEAGDIVDSWGTAEALIAARATVPTGGELAGAVAAQLTIGRHVLPDCFSVIAGFRSGLALDRFLALMGVQPSDRPQLDQAAAALEHADPGIAVDAVSTARPIIKGIGTDPSPAVMWRAVLEAISREGEALLVEVEKFSGPRERLVMTGGWARSDALAAIKEDILGTFVRPIVKEASARGAALLAGHAAGVYPSFKDLPRPDFQYSPRERALLEATP